LSVSTKMDASELTFPCSPMDSVRLSIFLIVLMERGEVKLIEFFINWPLSNLTSS